MRYLQSIHTTAEAKGYTPSFIPRIESLFQPRITFGPSCTAFSYPFMGTFQGRCLGR